MDLPEPSPPLTGDSAPAVLPPSSEPLSGLRFIFTGPNGIRAGWRLLMFVVIAVFFFAVLAAPVFFLTGSASVGLVANPSSVILGDAAPFFAALLAALVMGAVEGRTLAEYALPLRSAFGKRFWTGALWGFAALSVLLAATAAVGGFSFGALVLGPTDAAYYAVLWALGFLAVAFFEEFQMRGYALYTLTTGIGFWPSAILLSALFGVSHLPNRGENWAGALNAAFIGLFLCFAVRRTGDLWFAIGLHAAWDYAQSFVYSVPDSGMMVRGHLLNSSLHGPGWLTGGTVGPEGGVFGFIVVGVLFVVFDRTHRDARFPSAPRSHGVPSSIVHDSRPLGLGVSSGEN